MLRYLTAGESHGQALVVIVEGLPAGLAVTVDDIQGELARRRLGYGRGPAPALRGRRADADRRGAPRPHAGVAGRHRDRQQRVGAQRQVARGDVAGARERRRPRSPRSAPVTPISPGCRSTGSTTPATCSSGPAPARPRPASPPARVAKLLLGELGVARALARRADGRRSQRSGPGPTPADLDAGRRVAGALLRSGGRRGDDRRDQDRGQGRRLAGRRRRGARRTGVPVGLGSHVHWDRKLDALLAQAVMSIQAVKGGRDRRRLRGRRTARQRGPRRHPLGRRRRRRTAATPRSPAASRAACRPASCSWSGRR